MEGKGRRGLGSPALEEAEWVPLDKHHIFGGSGGGSNRNPPTTTGVLHCNLLSWDGASHLYIWDSNLCCINRLSLRFGEPASIEATSSFKLLYPDIQIHFAVCNISINRAGSSLILAGPSGLCIMYLYERMSTKDNIITCRTVSVGSQIYFDNNSSIRTLHASWHPYGDTHLGILSSDSVLRLFDLSSDLEQPEQEYYLQPVEPGRLHSAVSICPIAFSFGGEHLWDRFSVFFVFSDGSIHVLCPVVPFGSFYSWVSIEEIYKDAHMYGLKSSNSQAVTNSSLAIAWLEATFPQLVSQAKEGGSLLALKAHPYVPFDASLALQGPLRKVCHREVDEGSQVFSAECEGRAVSFLYNTINKDSILVTAWSSGQLQIDALADELQPVWKVGSSPSIRVDSSGQIIGVAMICGTISEEFANLDKETRISNAVDTVWLGCSPPLLRLAVVDLALPEYAMTGLLSIFTDPLVPERIYCLHGGGIDLIMLHFLPFSSHAAGKDEAVKSPSVYPIVTTCHGDTYSASPLCGLVSIADSFGNSWIVGLTSYYECIVIEMKGWNMVSSLRVKADEKSSSYAESSETLVPDIISKELLVDPEVDLTDRTLSYLRSLTADSIEGRSSLHHYFKLFHENYVEYAHKVYVGLKYHVAYLERILADQHARLYKVKRMLLNVEEKQVSLDGRINRAAQVYGLLEERLRSCRSLPGVNRKPLSRAEREFQSQLERFTGMELEALHSSIEALDARLRRYRKSSQSNVLNTTRRIPGRTNNHVSDAQIMHLKSAMAKLSLVNSENTKKVKLVESALRTSEGSE